MSLLAGMTALGVAVPAAVLAALLIGPRMRVPGAGRLASGRSEVARAAWTSVVARLRRRLRGPAAGPELGIICACVAARVRSGDDPAHAWASELADRGLAVEPGPADAAHPDEPDGLPRELVALVGRSAGADATLVATRVALRSGAPLADVLDAVSVAVAEAEAADADRRRAHAGPATTARLLGWLPLVALLLGAGLGADPVSIAAEGGLGLVSMAVGLLLMFLGRAWARALVRAAARDDEDPAHRPRRDGGGTR